VHGPRADEVGHQLLTRGDAFASDELVEEGPGEDGVPGQHVEPGPQQHDVVAADLGHGVDPADHGGELAPGHHGVGLGASRLEHPRGGARPREVLHPRFELVTGQVPVGRPLQQLPLVDDPLLAEVLTQQGPEERVVAEPLPAVVEATDEQRAPVEVVEHLLAVVPPGDGIAQRRGQAPEDRRLQQEAADVGRLMLHDVLGQVLGDVPVVTGEGGEEPVHIAFLPK
jgi:hypothetical protein